LLGRAHALAEQRYLFEQLVSIDGLWNFRHRSDSPGDLRIVVKS
jgi:hypothetical protein